MFRKFLTVTAVTAPVYLRSIPQLWPALADDSEAPKIPDLSEAPRKNVDKIIVQDDGEAEDDTAWVLESQGCSFCSFMISSPCKIQFRQMVKCIAKSKELKNSDDDMRDSCVDYAAAMTQCEDENHDYFYETSPAEGEGAEGGHSEPNSTPPVPLLP